MALIKRLAEVRKAALPNRLHVELLDFFAQCGGQASIRECFELLRYLKDARELVRERGGKNASPRQPLLEWARECRQHSGFTTLRDRLLTEGRVAELSSPDLTRLYTQLIRLGFLQEAALAWELIEKMVTSRAMVHAAELLAVWQVAPLDKLPVLDAAVARTLKADDAQVWKLAALSRAPNAPESKAVTLAASELRKRLKDMRTEDLARLATQLGVRLSQDFSTFPKLRALMREAKAELVARNGSLETVQLVGLLGTLEGSSDNLWHILHRQLSDKLKSSPEEFSALQALQVLRAFRDCGAAAGDLNGARRRLEALLMSGASPGIIDLLSRNMELVEGSHTLSRSLLNAAVRLKGVGYPTILWGLFTRVGEAGLVSKYPDLKYRIERIGATLERNGFKKGTMTLRGVEAAARAMNANGVPLRNCLAQMTSQFLDVHAKLVAVGDDAGILEPVAEEDRAASPSSMQAYELPLEEDVEGTGVHHVQVDGLDAPPSLASRNALHAEQALPEVRLMMISFWAQLCLLGIDEERLTAMVERVFDSDCCVDSANLGRLAHELRLVTGQQADRIRGMLLRCLATQLPKLADTALVPLIVQSGADGAVMRHVAAEIGRRLTRSSRGLGENLDSLCTLLLSWASWSWVASDSERAYIIDNTLLQATTEGIGFRFTCELQNLDSARTAKWGAVIRGVSVGDDWLKVQGGYLPMKVQGVPVVLPKRDDDVAAITVAARCLATCLADEKEIGCKRLAAAASALAAAGPLETSEACSAAASALRRTLHQSKVLSLAEVAGLGFVFSSLYGGRLPYDVAAHLWQAAAGSTIAEPDRTPAIEKLSVEERAQLLAFGLAALRLSSPSVLMALRLSAETSRLEAILSGLARMDARVSLSATWPSESLVHLLAAVLAKALPDESLTEGFKVPGTPYVADIALEAHRLLLIVPRAVHRGPGVVTLGGQGRLLEATMQASGYHTRWVWPEIWESRLMAPNSGALEARLHRALHADLLMMSASDSCVVTSGIVTG